MWSGKIPHVIYYTLYNQHAWRREIVILHSNHTRLGTVTLPLFHHMSNMTPKEVEETCPSCETWGVLGSWLKVTECQIAFIMNLNAKKRLHFVFSVLQKSGKSYNLSPKSFESSWKSSVRSRLLFHAGYRHCWQHLKSRFWDSACDVWS